MDIYRKTLFLARHAKSSWKDASLDDRDRPLNKRGKRSAPDMGRRMSEQDLVPDLIISSPAKRAYVTAKKFAREFGYKKSDIVLNEDLYFAGVFAMCSVLEAVDDQYNRVMMVGHNPAMTSLLNSLCDTSIFNMPTSAVAVIGFDMESWADLEDETGVLLGYGYPKGPRDFSAGVR